MLYPSTITSRTITKSDLAFRFTVIFPAKMFKLLSLLAITAGFLFMNFTKLSRTNIEKENTNNNATAIRDLFEKSLSNMVNIVD